jgi:Fungal protein of unknown function (DUF1752)
MATEIISDSQSHFASSSGLRRTKSSQSALYAVGSPTLVPKARRKDKSSKSSSKSSSKKTASKALNRSSPALYTPPSISTKQSSSSRSLPLGLADDDDDEDEDDDDDIGFLRLNQDEIHVPIFNINIRTNLDPEAFGPPPSPQPASSSPDDQKSNELINVVSSGLHLASKAEDDMAAISMPSRQVDYLSHEWREEEIWASWSYIVSRRKQFGERSRLENASWRSWAKQKNHLRTISPKELNWMKDCDVTWLYGPLQHPSYYTEESEPASHLSKTNSFLHKKPILKKRSMSEMMLQKSLSASSLVREAATAVQAQRRPGTKLDRRASDYSPEWISSKSTSRAGTDYFSSQSTSGLQTPSDHAEKRHIRFATKVEQCIAVDVKEADEEEEEEESPYYYEDDDDDDSEDGIVMMKRSGSRKKKPPVRPKHKRSSSSSSSRRGSVSEGRTTIQMLPATTLKDRIEPAADSQSHSLRPSASWTSRSPKLSPSPSVETLRPSDPDRNFLIPDDDDEYAEHWASNSDFHKARRKELREEFEDVGSGMRRTPSGMMMPVDDNGEDPAFRGLVGRMLDTVNTARDIAHVIWNVGWNKVE